MIIENNPLTLRSLLRLFMNCENHCGLIFGDKKKICAPVPLLLAFPLFMGKYEGHTMQKNAPLTCPLTCPLHAPSFPNNRKQAWKQGLIGSLTAAV